MLRCHWRQNLGAKWTPVTRSLFSSTNHRASKDNHILQGNSSGLQQNTTHSCTKALTYMYLRCCVHACTNYQTLTCHHPSPTRGTVPERIPTHCYTKQDAHFATTHQSTRHFTVNTYDEEQLHQNEGYLQTAVVRHHG